MGAKPPSKLKLRRPTYKCEECDKKFLSVQALKTHQFCLHKIKVKPKIKNKLGSLLGRPVKRTPAKQSKSVDDKPEQSDAIKIEYECPQCRQRFPVHFSAFRHIQRHHPVNSRGEKVPFNSPDILKPLRVETCKKCNMRVRLNELHSCTEVSSNVMAGPDADCMCLGCQQTFPTPFMFDLHVSGLHSDTVETMFFPNLHTFSLWKVSMETQSGVKYLVMGKYNMRQTYRCTFATARSGAPAQCCPSSIIIKEFSKSIQVNFFKEHFGHSCKYSIPDRFKKYLSTEVMKNVPEFSYPDEEDDLYAKVRTVLNTVIISAFNSDANTLKILLSKAVDMEKIFRQDAEPKAVKNMTDEQITETLESLNGKRKSNDSVDAKKGKTEEVVAKKRTLSVKGTKRLASKDTSLKDYVKKTKAVNDGRQNISLSSPIACFNDSYKEFVDKITEKESAFKLIPEKAKSLRTYGKKKVVKTKIGQYKPNVSPKKEIVSKEEEDLEEFVFNFSPVKVKQEFEYEVIEQENDCNILVLKM